MILSEKTRRELDEALDAVEKEPEGNRSRGEALKKYLDLLMLVRSKMADRDR